MSHSRNPYAYPPFFATLVGSFPTAPDTIEFTLPEYRLAHRNRLLYYAYIRALEYQADKLQKQGSVQEAMDLRAQAKLARTRSVEIHRDLTSPNSQQTFLRFVNRDTKPDILAMADQLQQQLPAAAHEPLATPNPILDTLPEDPTSLFTPDEDNEPTG